LTPAHGTSNVVLTKLKGNVMAPIDDGSEPLVLRSNWDWSALNLPPLRPLADFVQLLRDMKKTIDFHNKQRTEQPTTATGPSDPQAP
jgi:hypothetical protein